MEITVTVGNESGAMTFTFKGKQKASDFLDSLGMVESGPYCGSLVCGSVVSWIGMQWKPAHERRSWSPNGGQEPGLLDGLEIEANSFDF